YQLVSWIFWGYPAAALAFTRTMFSFSEESTVTTFGRTLWFAVDKYCSVLSPNSHRGLILNCFNNSDTTFPDNLVLPRSISAVVLEIPIRAANSAWVYPRSLLISVERLITISKSSPIIYNLMLPQIN